jgi:hypothetical protein
LTAPSFVRLHSAEGAPLESGPRSALPPLTYSRQCVERLAGLDKNRRVAGCGRVLAHDHLDIERVQVDTPADVADLVGGYEGRARAEEWVDDDVAAIGEVEERVREHRGRLGGRVVLKAAAGGPRPGLLARGFVAPTR